MIGLETRRPIWPHVYTVAPLVVIGTKEGNTYDMAPKHMAMPLGRENFFGFICTPQHSTWHNVLKEGCFSVSYPKPDQVTITSLAASPRCGEDNAEKPVISGLPTVAAPHIDTLFLRDAYLCLECRLLDVMEGFGEFGLIAGEITGAYVDEDYKIYSELSDDELIRKSPLLAYIAYGRFATIEDTMAFPFPRGFETG